MRKVVLLVLFAWTAVAVAADTRNDPLNAVVKVEVTSSEPNFVMPWQNRMSDDTSGSGVVIAGNRILTNAHIVADCTMVAVRKKNNDTLFPAKVLFVDHECDLALLTVDDPKFFADITPMEFDDTPPPQSLVVAAGFPIGGDGLSLTQGIISRIEVRRYSHSAKYLLTAQIDAAVNPGNSGGPVLYRGKVVGIAFQGFKSGESLGYMIPSDVIKHFFKDIEDGKVDGFGVLGFEFISLDNPDTRAYLKMSTDQTGIMVCKVHPGTDRNALKVGDVVLAVDGKSIANNGNIRLPDGQARHFITIANNKQLGEKVLLTLLRDGKIVNSELTVRKFHEQVEPHLYDKRPEYYIIGGLVFTRLSYSYLLSWGRNSPPDQLLRKLHTEKASPDENVVVLSMVLGDKVNIGYHRLIARELIAVNGRKIRNLDELVKAVEACKDEYITFTFANDLPVILNLGHLREANPRIMARYRVPADRYLNQK